MLTSCPTPENYKLLFFLEVTPVYKSLAANVTYIIVLAFATSSYRTRNLTQHTLIHDSNDTLDVSVSAGCDVRGDGGASQQRSIIQRRRGGVIRGSFHCKHRTFAIPRVRISEWHQSIFFVVLYVRCLLKYVVLPVWLKLICTSKTHLHAEFIKDS